MQAIGERRSLPPGAFLTCTAGADLFLWGSVMRDDDALSYLKRGLARYSKGDFDGAIADFDQAIRLDPDFSEGYFARGFARREAGDLDGAIADYSLAIRLNPDSANSFMNRGMVRAERSDWNAALADLEKVIRLKPGDLQAQHNLSLARANKDARLPSKIGRYRVICEVGRWFRGVVYLGRDDDLRRQVVVKSLALDKILGLRAHNEELRNRFVREGELLVGLRHPNIIQSIELGEHEGAPFIALEWLKGRSLDRAIEDGISLRDALAVIVQVLQGLAYVHKQGIVHNDITPANFFVQEDGSAKIVEFNLLGMPGPTQGGVLGTPTYMSPEPLRGEQPDSRSDLYSVGCVLFELVTGKRTYSSNSIASLVQAKLNRDPDWEQIPAGPEWERLRDVIKRALQRHPYDRYPSAEIMATDLALAIRDLGSEADRKVEPPLASPATYAPTRFRPDLFAQGVRRLRSKPSAFMQVNLLPRPRGRARNTLWLLMLVLSALALLMSAVLI